MKTEHCLPNTVTDSLVKEMQILFEEKVCQKQCMCTAEKKILTI